MDAKRRSSICFRILIKSFHFPGEETLIMMTKDFDPISEFPFHSEEFGEGMPSLEMRVNILYNLLF